VRASEGLRLRCRSADPSNPLPVVRNRVRSIDHGQRPRPSVRHRGGGPAEEG
jgi:hypothetical protein